MTTKVKERISEVRWLSVFATALTCAVISGGILWGWIELKGDQQWASNEKVDEIGRRVIEVESTTRSLGIDMANHKASDTHMPEAVRRATFVTREEWNRETTQVGQRLDRIQRTQEQQTTILMDISSRLPR